MEKTAKMKLAQKLAYSLHKEAAGSTSTDSYSRNWAMQQSLNKWNRPGEVQRALNQLNNPEEAERAKVRQYNPGYALASAAKPGFDAVMNGIKNVGNNFINTMGSIMPTPKPGTDKYNQMRNRTIQRSLNKWNNPGAVQQALNKLNKPN